MIDIQPKSMLDDNDELFEMTMAMVRPPPPKEDPLKKPARRVRVFKKKLDAATFTPDVDQVLGQLYEDEGFKKTRVTNKAFKAELRDSNLRLQRVKRGVPIAKVVTEEATKYKLIPDNYKYKNVGDNIKRLPNNIYGFGVQKVDFIKPINEDPQYQIYSKINSSEKPIKRLKKICSNSDELTVMYHNELLQFLNHSRERRHRAMKEFHDNIEKYGIEKARKMATRASQKSRLRVMAHYSWWQDFMDFTFSKPVGKNEEHLIEVLSRTDRLSSASFMRIYQDVKRNVKKNKRCIEMLIWINKRAHIVDDQLEMMLDDKSMADTNQMGYTHGFSTKRSFRF